MRRERILPWLVLISHSLVILIVVLDLLGLAMRYEEYAAVHGFDHDRQGFAQKSETNYVVRNLAIILVAGCGGFLSLRALGGGRGAARLVRVYMVCVVLFMVYNLTVWWLGGFSWN